ncbi:MAG: Alpha-amylase [Chitinophagaceae bacterium]|nr:Alpha-amylase [Chitinophagaceae bacterium]
MTPNETIMQFFHWYYPADGSLWNKLKEEAPKLKEMGITTLWLPPAYKSCEGGYGVGYGVYDLFDLGEFDQQGSVRTKYGTKDEYVQAVEAAHQNELKVIVDVVLNHRMGADETEKVLVQDQDAHDRLKKVGEPYEREILDKYTFPGRKGKYSQYIWDFQSFSGVNDKDDLGNNEHFYRVIHDQYGDNWDESVLGKENGNFDYLMGCDVDFRNPAVREELKNWLSWYYDLIKFDGIRLDAIKHMNPYVINELLDYTHNIANKPLLNVAEEWTQDIGELLHYKEISQGRVQMFDVPLHYHFNEASLAGNQYDIRRLFDNTLMQQSPDRCISFVENHDTQPLQMLESPVDFWFKPLANAIILLREQGIPCVFYTSFYGAKYTDKGKDGQEHEVELVPVPHLYEMIKVRRYLSYGFQRDYFDHPNTIGWTREGIGEFENSGCAVVLTNGSEGYKDMELGKRHAGQTFIDVTKNRQEEITINEDGWARFTVNGRSVSVWIRK